MNLPKNLDDLNSLIKNEVQENIHLDYKDSRAISKKKHHEIAKDISAFANSDGGIIIYGIKEDGHLPVEIDDGIDHAEFSREWLENVISSNIAPRIDDLIINQISLHNNHSVFAVHVPKSTRAPHQEQSSKRYYKRFNFKSQPMEDYEIQDIRNRSNIISPLVDFEIVVKHSLVVYFVISNIGKLPAENVSFKFSRELVLTSDKEIPPILKRGIKYLPPGKSFKLWYNTFPAIFAAGSAIPMDFEVTVKYFHPSVGQNITDIFYIDFNDYKLTIQEDSELHKHGERIEGSLNSLVNATKKLTEHIEKLSYISSPSGLDLSITTLRNLKHLADKDELFEKIDPSYCPETIFREALGIDRDLAYRLQYHFFENRSFEGIDIIEGISEDVIENFKKIFIINTAKKAQ